MITDGELEPYRWRELLEDVEPPTYHAVATAIADRLDVEETAAYGALGDALEAGGIEERDGPGAFPWIHAVESFEPDGDQGVPSEPTTDHYRGLDYRETVSESFGEAVRWDSWMPTCAGKNGKLPFAKYHDHPALEQYRAPGYDEPESDPRYSWSDPSNYSSCAAVDRQVRIDSELVGRAFIMQREGDPYTYSNDPPADPFLFADGDDVIDQATGEPIPEYVAAIELLTGGEPTFQEISSSESGAHAMLRGRLPDGSKTRYIQLRDEPLDGFDDPPMLELYEGPHVIAFTGERIEGAPETYADVDRDGLRRLIAAGTRAHPNVLAATASRSSGDGSAESGERVTAADVEPGLSIDPESSPDDAPDDLPKCYRRTLTARYTDERLPIGNHGVNLYAAILGVASGYDVDECTEHFALFAPNGDRGKVKLGYTKKELRRTAKKVESGLRAPGVAALRRAGLFDRGKSCNPECPIHGDGVDYVALLPELDDVDLPARTEFGPLEAQRPELDADPKTATLDASGPPSIADVRARTADQITDVMSSRSLAVVDGIMGGGKTYNAIGGIAEREEAGTYLAGRKDLYEQAKDYATEVGIAASEVYVLPTPDDCSVWTGEYGGEWRERVRGCYHAGATMSAIHAHIEGIPCSEGERECPYAAKNQYDPDDYLLLIGHHKHGHLPQVTAGRHVIVDEDPQSAYMTTLDVGDLKPAVNAFLSLADSPALDGFDDVLRARCDPERRREALRWYSETNQGDGFDFEPDERNACRFADRGYHAYAPHAVYALLTSEPIEDVHGLYDVESDADPEIPERYEFERASLPGIGNEAVVYTTSDRFSRGEEDDYYIDFQTPPDDSLSYARSVGALDGTPTLDTWSADSRRGSVVEWEYALGRPLDHRRVLSDDERAAFLAETMGHVYLQTSPYIRPYSGDRYRDPKRDAALLAAAGDQYLDGEPWDVVLSSKGAADTFRELGFSDGADDDGRQLARQIDHRGNVRGSDRYAECRTGAIIGSAHHGDHAIARRAARLGAQIRPEGKGVERTYGPTGDAILEQMRELDTAQTLLRIGRGEGGRGAIVLIDTCAIPEWIPIANDGRPTDVSRWSKGQRSVWRAVRELSEVGETFRTADVLDELDDSRRSDRTVQRALNRHADRGLLRKDRDPDDGRRWIWIDTDLSELSELETASVELPELTDRIDDANDVQGDSDKTRIGLLYGKCRYLPRHLSTGSVDADETKAPLDSVRTDGGADSIDPPDELPDPPTNEEIAEEIRSR